MPAQAKNGKNKIVMAQLTPEELASVKELLVVDVCVVVTAYTTCTTEPAGNLAVGSVPEVTKLALAEPICAD